MFTLFIDTHAKNVHIILYKDSSILEDLEVVTANQHSEVTMPTIAKILSNNNLDAKDLNGIIVVNGPGSFTGVRIGVTIAKTFAYVLNIPIRVIDSLLLKAICINSDSKIVSEPDRNGGYIGKFNGKNEAISEYTYLNKNAYKELKENNIVYEDVDIDYVKVFEFLSKQDPINAHAVKPLYVKGITGINDK